VQSSISQVKANQQALSSAETAAEATQAGFEVGTRTAVDVLNSLRSVFRARRDYASARYSYLQNNLALRQAAGTLSEKDVVAINAFLTESPKALVSEPQAAAASVPAADNIAVTPKQSKVMPEPAEQAPAVAEPASETGAESFDYYVMPGTSK
jgi:outer membrane protein